MSDIRRSVCAMALVTAFVVTAFAVTASDILGGGWRAAAAEAHDPWPDLVRDVFSGRAMTAGAGVIAIDMPYRAEDAALVPVTLKTTLPADDPRTVRTITLVIDENPAPVAATFAPGPGVTTIATRVRVDSYTNVHAVAELSDGSLHVATVYVKASGGCSAPTAKNAEEARAALGQMRFRQFAETLTDAATGAAAKAPDGPASAVREAQIMIRHPNHSGLQRDQVTLLYIPALFVRSIRVFQGDAQVLGVDGGISLSEDPNIRFTYRHNGAAQFRVEATDSDGHVFKGEWPVEAM